MQASARALTDRVAPYAQRMRRRGVRSAVARYAGACAVPLLLVLVGSACGSEPTPTAVPVAESTKADYTYTIPAGTAKRIAAGEKVSILPAELTVRVGETIRIVNQDDKGQIIGPFWVDAHGTVVQRFAQEGTFEGDCAVHASGKIVLKVLP